MMYLPGVAFAIGLALGGYAGSDWGGQHRYDQGVKDGKTAQRATSMSDLNVLEATLRAEALQMQIDAIKKADEQHATDVAEIEYARAQYLQATGSAAVAMDRLSQRVRDADAATHDAFSRLAMSQATPAAARTQGDSLAALRVVLARGRQDIVELAKRAEEVSGQLALCCSTGACQ